MALFVTDTSPDSGQLDDRGAARVVRVAGAGAIVEALSVLAWVLWVTIDLTHSAGLAEDLLQVRRFWWGAALGATVGPIVFSGAVSVLELRRLVVAPLDPQSRAPAWLVMLLATNLLGPLFVAILVVDDLAGWAAMAVPAASLACLVVAAVSGVGLWRLARRRHPQPTAGPRRQRMVRAAQQLAVGLAVSVTSGVLYGGLAHLAGDTGPDPLSALSEPEDLVCKGLIDQGCAVTAAARLGAPVAWMAVVGSERDTALEAHPGGNHFALQSFEYEGLSMNLATGDAVILLPGRQVPNVTIGGVAAEVRRRADQSGDLRIRWSLDDVPVSLAVYRFGDGSGDTLGPSLEVARKVRLERPGVAPPPPRSS